MDIQLATAHGVILSEENTLSYSTFEIPTLGNSDVKIDIHSAAINPSDVMFTKGMYPADKARPISVGFEGSGTVVEAGSDPAAQALIGKNVCFFSSGKHNPGSWSEVTVVSSASCVPLPGDLTLEEGATCLVNPLTVQGFLLESESKNYKCIVHSAAASQLGRMLVNGCKQHDLKLINVVRRQEQVDILKNLGAEYIINTGEENWKDQMTALFAELKPQAFFDAIGGETASEIIDLMPNNTTTYNYGALSLRPIKMSSLDLIFKGKVLRGYWLSADISNPEIAGKLFQGAF
jgi:NADPH:quinone reductase